MLKDILRNTLGVEMISEGCLENHIYRRNIMRKLRRLVAHNRMKKQGYVRVNKGVTSYFSKKWRKFA